MSGEVKAMALVTIEDNKTTIIIGPTDDDDFENGVEVVIPEEVIRDDGEWRWDPFGDLHDKYDCEKREAEVDSLRTIRSIVTRQHDEEHKAPRRWCTDPVCHYFFGDRPEDS